MIFGHKYNMLAQEGSLTQSSLLAGLEFLKKADYDKKGSYYAAFFQLSIGLERLMKIAVIMDFTSKNDLAPPTDKHLRSIGHKLSDAYEACKAMASERDMNMDNWFSTDTLEYDLLAHLSTFAEGARYFNLDSLVGKQGHEDPITRWHQVHLRIANANISGVRQLKINERAIAHCDKHRLFGFERSLSGEFRTQVDCTFIHELCRQSTGYCVWTVISILRPFWSLLSKLSDDVHELEQAKGIADPTVPYMHEFFPFCLCDKATATRRTKWINIY